MRSLFSSVLAAALLASGVASGDTITQWTFNSVPGDANTATGTTAPEIGTGTASLIGGTTASFASGDASGGSSDPNVGDDSAWNATTWPTLNANNETAGVQFLSGTTGFQDIVVSWDQRHSNSASRFFAFYFTTDGNTWTRLSVDGTNASPGATPAAGNPASTPGLFGANGTFSAFDASVAGAGDDWFNGRSVNLTSIAGVNNNPNFGFQIVSSWDSGTGYSASSGNAYATTGTSRFDMVTVSGTAAIPEPSAATAAGALTVLALVFQRRRA
jgi:hypothetical protein